MTFLNGQFFFTYIDPVATWVGLATFVFTLWIWFNLKFRERRLFDKLRREAVTVRSDHSAALIVDLLGKGAAAQAKRHAEVELGIKDENRIVKYGEDAREIRPEDVSRIVQGFQKQLRKVSTLGADRIFLFVSAPTPISLAIGVELANYGGVTVMHYNAAGKYEIWGPLRFRGVG